jgi:hypothetical protein
MPVLWALLLLAAAIGGMSGSFSYSGHASPSAFSTPVSISLAAPSSQPSATLSISPGQISEGQSISVQTTVTGGTPPYSFSYTGLPSGCQGQGSQSFSCQPTGTGNFNVQVTVTDSFGNLSVSNSAYVDVTASTNGNNNNNNGNGSNSSSSLSGLLGSVGGFLSLVIVFGIVGFVTWILLVVGVWIIAIVLMRRLPKRGALANPSTTVKCPSCASAIPSGTKFCPDCGAATAPRTT